MEFASVMAAVMMPVNSVGEGIMTGIDLDLSIAASYAAAVLGSLIPVPFLMVVLNEAFLHIWPAETSGCSRFAGRDWIALTVTALPFMPASVWLGAAASVLFCRTLKKGMIVVILGSMISGAAAIALSAADMIL